MNDPKLLNILEELIELEPIFHSSELGRNRTDFEKMTDANFWEVGASGRRYSREYVINTLVECYQHPFEDDWSTRDFHCLEIAEDNYLLTYTLVQGERVTHRAAIWRYLDNQSKIFYHQDTIVQDV